MTKEEAIRVLCSMDVPEGNKTLIDKDSHEALTMAIDALSKPSLPSNLDEAARAYSRVVINGEERFIQNDKYAFKAGAAWMAGQGVTVRKKVGKIDDGINQIPTYCNGFEVTELDVPFLNSKECGYGNEVIVQIRKK